VNRTNLTMDGLELSGLPPLDGQGRPVSMTHRNASQPAVSLRQLLTSASFIGCADVTVTDVCELSQDCTPGCLFAALPGTKSHGRDFVVEAIRRGAAAILTDRPLPRADVPQCIVPDARRVYSELCHSIRGNPSKQLGVVGVTGTNGKTTTTWFVRSLLENAGRPAGLLGTIEYSDGIEREPSHLTTPDARSLAQWLSSMVARRTRFATLEMSSHALHQSRTAGIGLDVAIVTNVTQDHFDYHGDRQAYTAAKAKIFQQVKRGGIVVLNSDDPGSAGLWETAAGEHRVVTFGIERDADIEARVIRQSADGTTFRVRIGTREQTFHTPLIGRHNISNALGAIAACDALGLSLDEMQAGLDALNCVPGRLERIDCGQPFNVFVDFAHTEDALRRVIATAREVTTGRVICLFGAGGDRDRTKRPGMAAAAATADFAIVTSDNPRSEDPRTIIQEILAGFRGDGSRPLAVVDREEAIERALELAEPGDTVILAGKGHEKVQIIGQEQLPFDDAAMCRQRLTRQVIEEGIGHSSPVTSF
jgi:UDP-N-acetylmuramoyl-L-alanyl-D-glutamate--2,6-diaminopimelate ligase